MKWNHFPIRVRKGRSPAQGMVEFALVLPLFLMMVYGMIEFGRLMATRSFLFAAVREAARYGTAIGNSAGGIPKFLDCDGMIAASMRIGSFAGIEPGDVEIWYDTGPDDPRPHADLPTCPLDPDDVELITLGHRIVVRITKAYDPWLLPVAAMTMTSETGRTIFKAVDIKGTMLPSPTPRNTRTPTITPTETQVPTPTDTPTETEVPTPTETPTITETLEFTYTPTETATETVVPSETPTITPTATPDCSLNYSDPAEHPTGTEYYFHIFNESAEDREITDILFSWGVNKKLTNFTFTDDDTAAILYSWTGSQPYSLDLELLEYEYITLPANGSLTLYMRFLSTNDTTPVIDMTLENSCTISTAQRGD